MTTTTTTAITTATPSYEGWNFTGKDAVAAHLIYRSYLAADYLCDALVVDFCPLVRVEKDDVDADQEWENNPGREGAKKLISERFRSLYKKYQIGHGHGTEVGYKTPLGKIILRGDESLQTYIVEVAVNGIPE